MKEYKEVYAFNVLSRVKEGKEVRVLDREREAVESVNLMPAEKMLHIVNQADKLNDTRYYFYMICKEDENE